MRQPQRNIEESMPMHPETVPSVLISSKSDPDKVNVIHYRAYLPSALEDYQPLVPLLDVLHHALPGDTVTLVLNGDGGHVTTAAHLSTAIHRSQAVVLTEACGRISSAHTLATLSGDVVLPVCNTIAMVHNMSMGTGGSGREPIDHVKASLDWCSSLFEEHQIPFLSMEELHSIFEYNTTIWMPHEADINDRIYTTMWYRASIGVMKPEAFNMFIDLVQQGIYEGCKLVNINTMIGLLEGLCEEHEVACAPIWSIMAAIGMFGEHNNPMDFILSDGE